ncbi:hypothetical protein GCK72_006496 [Caenorhabditis remanei]|uniref:Poly(A) RNA polymerase mitochondrial-like central palm domain-containing protein n=1 Tax=Caenorhabditis remanei TaxID=31234 RepID=A0A6A5HGW1_CAERE|nr:hypothetical protein GCK72_006496 [Caenorhabditis remanei]KAF1766539.1 hypothetical protein GCK72_006496 [Caenorhabditis remanei]
MLKPPKDLLPNVVNMIQNDHPYIKALNEDINKLYIDQKQSEELSAERESYIAMIRLYLKSETIKKQIEPQGVKINRVTVFGSFSTHCASKDSDLDLCVCASNEGAKKALPVTVLQTIYRELVNNIHSRNYFFGDNEIREISFVSTAKVPIIRFMINNVPVDLSATFENTPPRTSLAAKYINAYCQLDDRFKVLVTFLKTWMKSEGSAEDHLRDFPNSYSLILLLIHVLQWYDIVPNLHETHTELFHHKHFKSWKLADVSHEFKYPLDENTIAMHNKKETRKLSIVQLLYLFACQYSEESIMMYYRFNMKNGMIEGRSQKENPVTIVDVYDTRNPARSARSILDMTGSLTYLRRLFLAPRDNMFALLMKITVEKPYLPQNAFPYPMYPPMMNGAASMYQIGHFGSPQFMYQQPWFQNNSVWNNQNNGGQQGTSNQNANNHSNKQYVQYMPHPPVQSMTNVNMYQSYAFGQYPFSYSQYPQQPDGNVKQIDNKPKRR